MRLHLSAKVNEADIIEAASAARADVVGLTEHRSTAAIHAFEVRLSGLSPRRTNGGNRGAGGDYAASWDQWGMVLADLYQLDPEMIVGPPGRPIYADADDFHDKTDERYRALTLPFAHHDHHWEHQGRGTSRVLNRLAYVSACDCGATLYRPM